MVQSVQLTRDNKILIMLAGSASYLDAALLVSMGVALPLISTKMHLNSWSVGLPSTTLSISVALGAFIGGWLSDRFGRTKVFNLDILFVGIGALIIALAQTLPVLMVGIIIAGFASGADLPTSLAVIADRMSKQAYGRAITITQIFWTVGILLSQFIGFLSSGIYAYTQFILFGWIFIVAMLNWGIRVFSKKFKTIEENLVVSDKAYTTEQKVSIRYLMTHKQYLAPLVLLTVFYLFWNLPANTWGSFINYFLMTVANKSQTFATTIAIIANIVCLLVAFFYTKFADTKFRNLMMYVGIFIALFSFMISGIFSSYWQLFSLAYILYSGSTVLCGEPLFKIWSQLFYEPDVRASLTGISIGIVRALTAIYSLVTPALMAYSSQLFFAILTGCVIIFGICAVLISRSLER